VLNSLGAVERKQERSGGRGESCDRPSFLAGARRTVIGSSLHLS
jgi:hypothetical protein